MYKYTKKFFENFIFLLTKYKKIIRSRYFAILSMICFPIEKQEIKFHKSCSFRK